MNLIELIGILRARNIATKVDDDGELYFIVNMGDRESMPDGLYAAMERYGTVFTRIPRPQPQIGTETSKEID